MSTCMDCIHWSPKTTPSGMSRLGFAACLMRPIPGHAMSAHAAACAKFDAATEATANNRHAKWDIKKVGNK